MMSRIISGIARAGKNYLDNYEEIHATVDTGLAVAEGFETVIRSQLVHDNGFDDRHASASGYLREMNTQIRDAVDDFVRSSPLLSMIKLAS